VLETPLFEVRNKEQTMYCYSENERDDRRRKLGKTCEITRFKGLGEISPNEFKQFIGKEMRLSQVELLPSRKRPASSVFNGQEHTRTERLHHGESRGIG